MGYKWQYGMPQVDGWYWWAYQELDENFKPMPNKYHDEHIIYFSRPRAMRDWPIRWAGPILRPEE